MEQIHHVFRDSYLAPERFPLAVLQIIGPAGIGKTSTVLKFSKLLEQDFVKNRLAIKIAYVNLKLQGGNKYAIYRLLLERIAPELPAQGLSAEEMLRYLLRYLHENRIHSLIILDEIDYLIKSTKDSSIIYDLTRLNEFDPDKPCNVKGVIFIARSTEFYNRLDQAELSTLGRVIDETSKITISPDVNGDVRYALDLLLYAGNLAESQGTGRINLDQIRKVHGQINPSITTEEVEGLSKSQIFTLMALVRALRIKKKQYVELKEIRLRMSELSEEFKLKKLDIEDSLHDLQLRKMIEFRSLKEIGIHGASLQELEPILQKQIKRNSN
jgi:cell division control protein 6